VHAFRTSALFLSSGGTCCGIPSTFTTTVPSRKKNTQFGRLYISYSSFQEVDLLYNEYYALRHGRSLANEAGIIASDPNIACFEYGLSSEGQLQAKQAGIDVVRTFESGSFEGLLVLSSDLLRAKETAQAVFEQAKEAGIPMHRGEIVFQEWLRERGFGEWDGTSDSNYAKVWLDDEKNADHVNHQVESVSSVIKRVSVGLLEWDSQVQHIMIVCVAHGDVLQILQTAMKKMDGRLHRSLPHLETATLRKLGGQS